MLIVKISIFLIITILLSGCGAELKLSEYTKSTLSKTNHMPSKSELNVKSKKVIMMPLDNNEIKIAKNAKLGNSMISKLNTKLASSKNVRIIKRVQKLNNSLKLAQEVKASELSKEIGSDIGQADFIITGQINNATYEHTFHEGYYYDCKNSEGKKVRCYSKPYMSYRSCVEGSLKVFQLPELLEVFSEPFNRCSSNSTEVRSSRNIKRSDNGLVRKAGSSAIDKVIYPLSNFFAKKGYIYQQRVKSDEKIIKVTIGSEDGAIKGDKVFIYRVVDEINPLTGEKIIEDIKIGEGIISNQITAHNSWIIIDEMYENYIVKSGDYVKIFKERGLWSW